VPAIAHPGGAQPVKGHAQHLGRRDKPEIAPAQRRPQKRVRRRMAPAAPGGQGIGADAFGQHGVAGGKSGLLRRGQVMPAQLVVLRRAVADPQRTRPGRAPVGRDPAFHPLEGRRRLGRPPARVSRRLPVGEIRGQAADIDHRVDRRRAAQQLAARPVDGASVKPRLGLGAEPPVHARVVEQPAIADRHPHVETPVGSAGLQKQHVVAAIRAQPLGQHATGRARADDDIVDHVHRAAPGPSRPSAAGSPAGSARSGTAAERRDARSRMPG
jgi:hypothetical protein